MNGEFWLESEISDGERFLNHKALFPRELL
jgi:hypothetical protein